MTCPRCGAEAAPDAAFCIRCGAALPRPVAPPADDAFRVPSERAEAPAWGAATYPAPSAVVVVPVPVVPVRYAGFWRRWAAAFLDAIILSIVTIPLSMLMNLRMMANLESDPEHAMNGLFSSLGAIGAALLIRTMIEWFYFAYMESSSRQATLGKMALGIKVTDLEGRPISFSRATGRFFAKWISGMTLLIGYIVQVFTERRQALHDLIARTLVIRSES